MKIFLSTLSAILVAAIIIWFVVSAHNARKRGGSTGLQFVTGGGNVSSSGTPLLNQLAMWTDATHIMGSTVLGKRVSVRDPPYNAAGDGVTDDTEAINGAMYTVVAAGGGTVYFPRGKYLCNINHPHATGYNAILQIPWVNANTTSAVSLELIGEQHAASAVATAFDWNNASTIMTTATSPDGSDAALLAGSPQHGTAVIAYTSMNNVMLAIRNLNFQLANESMNGVYLGGVGWALVENCQIQAPGSVAPTHGTTGLWMPNTINFGKSQVNYVQSAGWDSCFMLGEHTRAPWIYAALCNNGVTFLPSNYPSWANIILDRCVRGVSFAGYHIVDMMLAIEHQTGGWFVTTSDIYDPTNNGAGNVRYYIGNGMSGSNIAATVNGAAGLNIQSLFSGNIALATGAGAGGSTTGAIITGKGTVPTGGTTNQVLQKNSNTNYDVGWATVKYSPVTVAALPASPSTGQIAAVSDGLGGLTWGATVVTGGSSKYLVWWNGSNWTVVGK